MPLRYLDCKIFQVELKTEICLDKNYKLNSVWSDLYCDDYVSFNVISESIFPTICIREICKYVPHLIYKFFI